MSTDVDSQETQLVPRKAAIDTAWHVAVLAAITTFITTVTLRNLGIFFVGLMEEFDANRGQATWPISVQVTALQSAAVVVVLLQQRFSIGRIAILGSVLLWLGLVTSAFVPSIPWMGVTFGLIHGGGKGTTLVSINTILLSHFNKYRGVASGIRYAGETCSGLVFPKILVLLEDAYGFRGMVLIIGAMLINATALVSLLKVPRWLRQPQPRKDSDVREETAGSSQTGDQKQTEPRDTGSDSERSRSTPHIMAVFRKPMFFVAALLGTITHYTQNIFLSTMVDFAIDRGMSLDTATSLIVYTSLTDLLGALGIPLFADRKILRRSTLVMWCYILVGLCMILFPSVTSVPLFVLVSLLLAMFEATIIAMKAVIMADYLGVEMIPICFAASGVVSIPLFLLNSLIVGYFRDNLGSYDNLYRVVGGMNFFMAFLFFGVVMWEHLSFRKGWTPLN